MNVLDICDEIASGIEPDQELRDDGRAQPSVYAADLLYLWPRTEVFGPAGDGSLDEERFRLRLAWATPAEHELAAQVRERGTTEVIHTKVAAIAAWIRAHRTGGTYEALALESVDYESLVTLEARGAFLDLTGYIYGG